MTNKRNDDVSHSGHRLRLTELIAKSGIENVSNVQAVEYFLTYIIPRGDVNPLAHRLLDKFENFGNIIDASENELMQVKGINKRSASKIKLFSELIFYYSSSKMDKKLNLNDAQEFLNFVEELLRFQSTEHLIIFAFDVSFNFINKKVIDRKSVNQVGIEPYELLNFVTSTNPKHLVVAHNHPGGTAYASQNDYDAQKFIENLITMLNADLIDSLIVGKDGIYSQNNHIFVRNFAFVEDIINFTENNK